MQSSFSSVLKKFSVLSWIFIILVLFASSSCQKQQLGLSTDKRHKTWSYSEQKTHMYKTLSQTQKVEMAYYSFRPKELKHGEHLGPCQYVIVADLNLNASFFIQFSRQLQKKNPNCEITLVEPLGVGRSSALDHYHYVASEQARIIESFIKWYKIDDQSIELISFGSSDSLVLELAMRQNLKFHRIHLIHPQSHLYHKPYKLNHSIDQLYQSYLAIDEKKISPSPFKDLIQAQKNGPDWRIIAYIKSSLDLMKFNAHSLLRWKNYVDDIQKSQLPIITFNTYHLKQYFEWPLSILGLEQNANERNNCLSSEKCKKNPQLYTDMNSPELIKAIIDG